MNYINLLKVFVALLPIIVDLVKALESIGGAEGTGPEKLALVLEAVKAAFEQAKTDGVSWEKLEPLVRAAVERILAIIRK